MRPKGPVAARVSEGTLRPPVHSLRLAATLHLIKTT